MRDVYNLDDTIMTGRSSSFRRYQTKQGEQVNSREKQQFHSKNSKRSELKKRLTAEERQAYLDKERDSLPENFAKYKEYSTPVEIVREIKELNRTPQPRGFWSYYEKTHGLRPGASYKIRAGLSRKDVV